MSARWATGSKATSSPKLGRLEKPQFRTETAYGSREFLHTSLKNRRAMRIISEEVRCIPAFVRQNERIVLASTMHQRMYGLSFWWALAVYLRHRKWSFFWGYVSYKGDKLPKQHGQYMNRQFIASVKRKLGLKQQLLLDTKIRIFILPENHTRCPTFLYGV